MLETRAQVRRWRQGVVPIPAWGAEILQQAYSLTMCEFGTRYAENRAAREMKVSNSAHRAARSSRMASIASDDSPGSGIEVPGANASGLVRKARNLALVQTPPTAPSAEE